MTKDGIREATDEFIAFNEIKITSIAMYYEIYYKFQNGVKPDSNDYKAANKAMQPTANSCG